MPEYAVRTPTSPGATSGSSTSVTSTRPGAVKVTAGAVTVMATCLGGRGRRDVVREGVGSIPERMSSNSAVGAARSALPRGATAGALGEGGHGPPLDQSGLEDHR